MLQPLYTQEQINEAYYVWAAHQHGSNERAAAWDSYVDLRDQHPEGTTAKLAGRHHLQAGLTHREKRRIREDAEVAMGAA